MKIIDPSIQVEEYNPIKIMKNIERACRTCYRSEGLITDESYKSLIKNCINRGHESVLEHEKITIRMTCDIGVYKDLTRHRTGTAFSIESTRWCNYAKDKFYNQIHLIDPFTYIEDSQQQEIWANCMNEIENAYINGAAAGMKPDQLRTMLPHATAADVVMTCNIREWRHILKIRTQNNVHPEIRQLLIPLLLKFQYDMPDLFEDITYDKVFPKNWYAEIKELKGVDNND